MRALAILVVAGATVVAQPSRDADCREWTACRQLALDAAARKDYEAFHDLAWRAVQVGPKNDPTLLFLLARAQSLSGRPHDALVMLRRLAPTGVAHEAIASAEFERVRALRQWPEVAELLESGSPAAREPGEPGVREPEGPGAREPGGPGKVTKASAAKPDVALYAAAGAEALSFAAASFKPAALAYDAVSRRFIISDTDVSRLAVIDEFSHQLATLASGQSAGFGTVTAIAIDPRAGDLWVASVDGSSGEEVPALHKLQLISGRVLQKFASEDRPASQSGPFADIAVAPDGSVYAVQRSGMIWRLPGGRGVLAPTVRVTHSQFASVTVSNQGAVYIAGADGVMRFSPSPSSYLKAPDGVDLSGLARIRWSRGSLVGLQHTTGGSYRVIRIRVGRDGRSVTAVDVLDPSVDTPNPAAATVAGNVFYYLAGTAGPELAIRRIAIK